MAGELQGKCAAITGAASGISLACAKAMLDDGARAFLTDRDADKLEMLCEDLGENAFALVLDLLDGPAVSAILPRILDLAGGAPLPVGPSGDPARNIIV